MAHQPRASYCVNWADEPRVLVKLNADVKKIELEGQICKLLAQYISDTFSVPVILDMDCGAHTLDGVPCGWVIMTWFEGVLAPQASEPDILEKIAESLAVLHTLSVDFSTIEALSGIHGQIAVPDALAQHTRERRLSCVRQAIRLADHSLASSLIRLETCLLKTSPDENMHLVHGDFHLNNILVVPAEGVRQAKLIILDWEDATVDNPLSDVAHLIVSDGLYIGYDFMMRYVRLVSSLIGQDQIADIKKTIWLLAGVWQSRFLTWKLAAARNDIERSVVYREAMGALQLFLSEAGEG